MKVDHGMIGIKETHLHPGNPGTNNKEIVIEVIDTAQDLGGQVVVVAVVVVAVVVVAVVVVAVVELPIISEILLATTVIMVITISDDLRCKRQYR